MIILCYKGLIKKIKKLINENKKEQRAQSIICASCFQLKFECKNIYMIKNKLKKNLNYKKNYFFV
jgi:hypothetical protein